MAGAVLIAAFASTGLAGRVASDDRASAAGAAPYVWKTHAVPVYELDRARRPVRRGDLRAMDEVAREWSRALVAVVETCFVDSADFTVCDTASELDPWVRKLPYGHGPGTVQVVSAGVSRYVLIAWSRSGRRFVTVRDDRGRLRHRIDRGPAPPRLSRPVRPETRIRVVRVEPHFRIAGPRDSIRAVDVLRRGLDEQAQAMAQKLVPIVERCRAVTLDYTLCDTGADLALYGATSLPIGTAAGEVSVTASSDVTFTVTAESRIGNEFRISRTPGGELIRTCDTDGYAACRVDGSW